MVVHYRNPRKPTKTICGKSIETSPMISRNITSDDSKVTCVGCLDAIQGRKERRKDSYTLQELMKSPDERVSRQAKDTQEKYNFPPTARFYIIIKQNVTYGE